MISYTVLLVSLFYPDGVNLNWYHTSNGTIHAMDNHCLYICNTLLQLAS